MSNIVDTNQSILEVTNGIICHGVNCQGIMGAGLALSIKNKWPTTYLKYKEYCNKADNNLLGHVCWDQLTPSLYIAHCFTQYNYGNLPIVGADQDRHFQIWMLAKCLKTVAHSKPAEVLKEIHIPHIGAGLGGGNWQEIRRMIEKESQEWPEDIQLIIHAPR